MEKTNLINAVLLLTLLAAIILAGCGPTPEEQELIALGEIAKKATACPEPEPCPECPEVEAMESGSEAAMPLAMVTDQLVSEQAGRTYNLYISLPYDYDFSDASYPVIYVLDGDIIFGMASEVAHFASPAFADEVPGSIVVGIGYAASNAFEGLEFRTQDNDTLGSNYENFTVFLVGELIPYLEANYRVDPAERTLVGHSLTATYALSVLFSHPDTFSKILASSPDLVMNERKIFELEEEYAGDHQDLAADLYLSVGGLEETVITELEEFTTVLEEHGYEGLTVVLDIQPGEHHFSVAPFAISKGLRTLNQ